MAIEFKKQSYDGHFPEIWRGECKVLPGGFKPLQTFPVGTVLRRGTPLFVDFDAHTAAVLKAATVLDGGTTTKVRIGKGNIFAAGDSVTEKKEDATATATIKTIDTSNAEYDVLELDKALTGVAKNSIIVEAGEEAGAAKYEAPNAIVSAEKVFDGKGIDVIDAAFEAVVLYPSLKFPVLPEWKLAEGSPCMKLNPNILFITQ